MGHIHLPPLMAAVVVALLLPAHLSPGDQDPVVAHGHDRHLPASQPDEHVIQPPV